MGCERVRCGLDRGWWWVVKCFFKKRRGKGAREAGRRGKRGECVTALGKFKVTAANTAAGSGSGDRGRNFAASRPCVCRRGSAGECARVAGRAPQRAGWGRGGGAGRGRGEGGGASAGLRGGKGSAALLPRCAARRAPRLTRRAWTDAAAGAHRRDRKDLPKKSQTIDPARLRTPLFCSGRSFPLPLSLSFLEKLAS